MREWHAIAATHTHKVWGMRLVAGAEVIVEPGRE